MNFYTITFRHLLILSFSLVIYTSIFAQNNIEKGFILGVNSSGLYGNSIDEEDPILGDNTLFPNQLGENRLGYHVGFYMNKRLTLNGIQKQLTYQQELSLSLRGIYNQYEEINANLNYITSSHFINLFPKSKLSFLVGVEGSLIQNQENWGDLNIAKYDIGGVGGVLYKLPLTGLSVSARYAYGLNNTTTVNLLDNSRGYRNRNINFAVIYDPFVNRRINKNKPPLLVVEELMFSDTINANEYSEVTFKLRNSGLGLATGIQVFIDVSGDINGIKVPSEVKIKKINPNKTVTVKIPITSKRKTKTGNIELEIKVIEPNGFNPQNSPIKITIPTEALNPPSDKIRIRIIDHSSIISKVAVIGKESSLCDGSKDDGKELAEVVEGELLGIYGVVERNHLEEIIDEQRLAMSGLVLEDSDFAQAGCLAGAQGTVLASYGCLQGETKLQIKLVDCSTSDLYWSATGLDVSAFDLMDALRIKLSK